MSGHENGALTIGARELARAFDESFARPHPTAEGARVNLLQIRIGANPMALRLEELALLQPRGRVARVPGGPPALLGLAGVQGRIVPVFSLAALLGLTGGDERWLAVCADAAFGFDTFERYRVARSAELSPAADAAAPHVSHLAQLDGRVLPVLSVPSLMHAARAAVGGSQEQSP